MLMLRPAQAADRDRIRLWRNHPTVRGVSVTSHEITSDEHAAWFAATQDDPSTRVLIYEYDGRPAGVVTFSAISADNQSATWGFYLDNDGLDATGDTMSAWMSCQREAIAYAFSELDLDRLDAEVRVENIVVRRMNQRLGFVEGDVTTRPGGVRVHPICLTRATYERNQSKHKEHAR
jgi:UDP-4-amino-4,6-dideoxy-N-acetyl-beta-L-altrosamine N-acetyltransferase